MFRFLVAGTLQFRIADEAPSPRPEQDDLLRSKLTDRIYPRHELVKLADLIFVN